MITHSYAVTADKAAPVPPGRDHGDDGSRGQSETPWNDGGPAVPGVNEVVHQRQCEDDHAADDIQPGRAVGTGEEFDKANDCSNGAEANPCEKQPGLEVMPHQMGRAPVSQIAEQRQREADNRELNEQPVDRLSGNRHRRWMRMGHV